MRRKRLIKLTAWLNVAIWCLGMYAAKNTENVIFSICAVAYATFWLMAFFNANLDAICAAKEKPTVGAAGFSKRIFNGLRKRFTAIIAERRQA